MEYIMPPTCRDGGGREKRTDAYARLFAPIIYDVTMRQANASLPGPLVADGALRRLSSLTYRPSYYISIMLSKNVFLVSPAFASVLSILGRRRRRRRRTPSVVVVPEGNHRPCHWIPIVVYVSVQPPENPYYRNITVVSWISMRRVDNKSSIGI